MSCNSINNRYSPVKVDGTVVACINNRYSPVKVDGTVVACTAFPAASEQWTLEQLLTAAAA